MKALLLKDTYTLLKQMKLFFILVVVLAVIPGFSSSGFAIVYAALLPITALAYDERAKWDKLAVMMPYTTKDLVISKYVLGYLSIAAAMVLCIIAQYLVAAFTKASVSSELFPELAAIVAVSLLLMSINLPLVLKMGVEKGRMFFLVITVAVIISGVSYSEKYIEDLLSTGRNVNQIAVMMLVFTAAVSLASMLISIGIYKNKE